MPELLIILFILIILGVGAILLDILVIKLLPELARALGKSVREFREAASGLDEEEKEKEKKD